MSRTWKDQQSHIKKNSQRQISVRAVRRDPPDTRRLARALIALVMAQAEVEVAGPDAGRSAQPSVPTAKDLTNRNMQKRIEARNE